ncbi:MAG: HD domain-containing protein, partial [Bacilli bacterium]|nr:HD domain-containing protein [Bacilli bacterium]
GIYHSEKVLFFCYLLAELENLDDIDKQIIIDAAIYHDMGRQNDCEEALHGYASAIRIEKVAKNPIYKDETNLKILKAIVEGHSMPEDRKYSSCFYYELEDEINPLIQARYEKLYDVLKDADALDRLRFHCRSSATLDDRFLRLENSKKMIGCSQELNNLYYQIIKFNQTDVVIEEDEHKQCFHGIGFDFFKINSILKNGVLCKDEMNNRKLGVPTNFDGGNADRWISVVDASMVDQRLSAYCNFIMHGISFECDVPKMHEALPLSQRAYALLKGLPYDKSDHKDEKYVYKEIPASKITKINIPKDYVNMEIKDLSYLFNTLCFESLCDHINYYIKRVETNGTMIDGVELEESLVEYKRILDEYNHFDLKQKEAIKDQMPLILEKERLKINSVIQKWMDEYYRRELNQEKVTVADVVRHELKVANYDYDISDGQDHLCFNIEKNKILDEKEYRSSRLK